MRVKLWSFYALLSSSFYRSHISHFSGEVTVPELDPLGAAHVQAWTDPQQENNDDGEKPQGNTGIFLL